MTAYMLKNVSYSAIKNGQSKKPPKEKRVVNSKIFYHLADAYEAMVGELNWDEQANRDCGFSIDNSETNVTPERGTCSGKLECSHRMGDTFREYWLCEPMEVERSFNFRGERKGRVVYEH